jgi:signal transduction histidine kinase
MDIRTRLSLQFIVITATIFIIALTIIYLQFLNHTKKEYCSILENKTKATASMVLRNEDELKTVDIRPSDDNFELPFVENTVIYNDQFETVFATNSVSKPLDRQILIEILNSGSYNFTNSQYEAFGMSATSPTGRQYIAVTEGIFEKDKLNKLINILIITFILSIGLVAAAGWFFAGQALRPVSHIIDEVESIIPSDMSKRLKAGRQYDELAHLVDTFNRLLDRIDHAFKMQKGFLSNVSHELKNPIAAMDAQLQYALQKDRPAEDYHRILLSLQEDVQEITETAEKLLQLAKVNSDAGKIVFSEVRLDEIIMQTRDALKKTHPEYTVLMEIRDMPEQEDHLYVSGNGSLLRAALFNLFDNGCKFSTDKKVHVVISFKDTGYHIVTINDNGPGIPEADIQKIFEPFYRSPQHSHFKGSGVGLSLVKSILQIHKVSLEVFSYADKGTSFILKFPIENEVQNE